MLESVETIYVNVGVVVDEVLWVIRIESKTIVDHFSVEVLHYILLSSCRVYEVPVMKVWCRGKKRCWIPNRKECDILWGCGSFLWLGFHIRIVFQLHMWWFFVFWNLFQRLWYCFFQGSGMLAGVNCSYSTPEYCSEWILDKDAVK